MTERELSPDGDYQMVDENGHAGMQEASHALVELAQHRSDNDQNGSRHELERRSSQWVLPLFGRRRECSDDR